MSYIAFYRKYRPKNFDQVIDQDYIVQTLKNIIKLNKISHAYLFCGPRGTGKTSIAKIFANALNCIHSEKPEDICPICLKNANNSLDIIEIDAASNNSVEDVRELREKIDFLPINHPYKIYIIDEVHMLSKGAFNALLKTLEEPPKHVIFIFATTNPDKIPKTILSRVQRYNFKRISINNLIKQLKFVFDHEEIKYDEKALYFLATLANGSLRDALSMADQISAYTNKNISINDINLVFGLTSNKNIIELINYLAKNKISLALNLAQKLYDEGIDINHLINHIIEILQTFILFKTNSINSNQLMLISKEELNELNLSINESLKIINELIEITKNIKYYDNLEQILNLGLIKICSINNDDEEDKTKNQNHSSFLVDESTKNKKNNLNNSSSNFKDITNSFFINDNKQEKNNNDIKNNDIKNKTNEEHFLDQYSTTNISNHFDNFVNEELKNDNLIFVEKDFKTNLNFDNELNNNIDNDNFKNEDETNLFNKIKTETINYEKTKQLKNDFRNNEPEIVKKETLKINDNAENDTDTFSFSNYTDSFQTNTNNVKNDYLNSNFKEDDDYEATRVYDINKEENNILNESTQILNIANEDEGFHNEVDENILGNTNDLAIYDTNEIDFKENENQQSSLDSNNSNNKNKENTKEFSPNNIFNEQNRDDKNLKINYDLTQPEIINLFLLGKKETYEEMKKCLNNYSYFYSTKFEDYARAISEVKFITSSTNFVLVSSSKDSIINYLNKVIDNQLFISFINKLFNKNIYFFAITRKNFEDSRSLFKELSEKNNLPIAKPLPTIELEIYKNEIRNNNFENSNEKDNLNSNESKVKKIFSNLFNKRKG